MSNKHHPMNGFHSIQESLNSLSLKIDQNQNCTKRFISSAILELKHAVEEDFEMINTRLQVVEANLTDVQNKFQTPPPPGNNMQSSFYYPQQSSYQSPSQQRNRLSFADEAEGEIDYEDSSYSYGKGVFIPVFDKFDEEWVIPLNEKKMNALIDPMTVVTRADESGAHFIRRIRQV
jgi:hypothetical protein